ncbi:MAG: hypothetical protein WBA93_21505 [Microcoleaceae cyanobacterium]
MPPIKKLPNSIRYLKARFSHLTKPLVWGPIGVASLVLLFAWELSVHPEWLIIEDDDDLPLNSNNITELSPEEAAIAADIDNSSVLSEELETYKQLKINPLVIPTENLLGELRGEIQKKSTSGQSTTEPDRYFTDPEPEAKINNFFNPTPANLPQNLPSSENSNLLTSPLLPSVNLLDPRNQEEKNEETVNPLKAAMDEYLDVQNKSKSSTTHNSIGNTRSSLVPSSATSTETQSGEGNNFNPPLPPINVNITPQKPYYTDLSGSANQTNNQPNLSGSNYSPQVQPTTQNMPSLVPVIPNNLANNQNRGNGVNNWGTSNSYGNQGLPQNKQQQYNYGINHQVDRGGQQIPSYNQFSRTNGFYNRSYGNSWNNPFNNNNNQNR